MSEIICRNIIIFLFLLYGSPSLAAKEWTVAPGESLSAAVQAAAPGDVISVERGYYRDNLVIDKPLVLRGLNRPTLSGGNRDDVIRIKAKDVVIEGFIIRDSGTDLTAQNAGIYVEPGADRAIIRNNDLTYNLFGTWIEGVDGVRVINNLITGKRDLRSADRGNGIQLYNTTNARIIDNNISFCRDAIYVDITYDAVFRGNRLHHLRYGTHYMNSHNNLWENNESYLNRGGLALMMVRNQVVRNNVAWGNTDHGILLRTMQDSTLENNVVARNGKGFFIYDAEYNTVRNNLIINNRIGIHLWAGSIHNDVQGNDFIQNRNQVRYVAAHDEEWRNNYWSNYVGWDRDADGFGDVPYEANDLVDRLIWKFPYMKLLMSSPAVQTLRMVARQFPLLRSPSIVDPGPRMQPLHTDWGRWFERTLD
ncbi:MAG TPA: nitrous oxide reductase family maturation protein NosD [Gammaproteobacteria bacterium]|nr:nitrous oxide reductase family maturation protein NosD [Gammaproteobacteria bacterium]